MFYHNNQKEHLCSWVLIDLHEPEDRCVFAAETPSGEAAGGGGGVNRICVGIAKSRSSNGKPRLESSAVENQPEGGRAWCRRPPGDVRQRPECTKDKPYWPYFEREKTLGGREKGPYLRQYPTTRHCKLYRASSKAGNTILESRRCGQPTGGNRQDGNSPPKLCAKHTNSKCRHIL